MLDAASATMPLHCQHCGGPIEVGYEIVEDVESQTARFTCPYCNEPREFQAPGRVLWVGMRQPGEGPETKH